MYGDEGGDDSVSSPNSSIVRLTEIEGISCSDRGGLGKISTDNESSEPLDSSSPTNALSMRSEKHVNQEIDTPRPGDPIHLPIVL